MFLRRELLLILVWRRLVLAILDFLSHLLVTCRRREAVVVLLRSDVDVGFVLAYCLI